MSLTKATYSMVNGSPVNVLDYGADNSGVEDSTTAIQAAIDAACASGRSVFIPSGTYKLTDTIDLTSSASLEHNGAVVIGESQMNTILAFQSGVFTGIEMQGSDNIILKNFRITGPLNYGLVTGRSTGRQWGGNHTYQNIQVNLTSNLSLNNTLGSIGFGNFEGEEGTYIDCEFWADLPMVICAPNAIRIKTFDSSCDYTGTVTAATYTGVKQPMVSSSVSNTVYHFFACRFITATYQSPCVSLVSCSDVDFGNSFFQARRTEDTGTYTFARNPFFLDLSNVFRIKRFGTGESTPSSNWNRGDFSITGTLEDAVINAASGYKNSSGGNNVPLIYIADSGVGGGAINGCDIRYKLANDLDQLLLKYKNYSGSSGVNLGFTNSTIITNGTSGLNDLPQKIFFNAESVSIQTLSGASYTGASVEVINQTQRKIPLQKSGLTNSTANSVLRITLPTSGLSHGTVNLKGTVMANYSSGSYGAVVPFDVTIGWSRNSATLGLTTAVSASSFGTVVATDAAQITMTSPTFTTTLSGQAYFDVEVQPNISGAQAGTATGVISADVTMTGSYGFGATTADMTLL